MRKSFKPPLPQIGITTGDPAGVGPEVSLRAAQDTALVNACNVALFGDWEILRTRAVSLGLSFDFERLTIHDLAVSEPLPERAVVDVPAQRAGIVAGRGSRESGDAAAQNILTCFDACNRGFVDSMVTAPISKTFLREAGFQFPGHTEFLAHLAGGVPVAMAFLTERLKVVLTTIHVALRTAVEQITEALILEKLEIILREFPRLGLPCRRLAVAGVNPHAGESGLLGREEIEVVEPTLGRARHLHPEIDIEGPVPADTLFHRAAQGEFDVVLAMFHDQGLSPIKLLGFGEAVNVTLGLPFVRTNCPPREHGLCCPLGIEAPECCQIIRNRERSSGGD